MRILIGHLIAIPEIAARRPLPGREACGDDVIAFGQGYPAASYDPAWSWAELLANVCPSGWTPDVYVHVSPEYNLVPVGLEKADCLTVGVFGDWNLGGQSARAVGGMFDMLVADRNGCDLLAKMGFDARYAPIWAFDPALHRRLPGIPRDIDVLMLGNLNHAVQWERSQWLARVAKLSRKHRVVVSGGVYGEEYTRLMNRARIVFNRSIRGETNMRAYEAAACGALMFYEAENREIRDLYTDREECVLYDDSNLEYLLHLYLSDEAERARVAENGWRKVQGHTYAHHAAQLFEVIEERLREQPRSSQISLSTTNESEKLTGRHASRLALGWHGSTLPDPRALAVAEHTLAALRHATPEDAQAAHAHAIAQAELAARYNDPHRQRACWQAAFDAWRNALNLRPDYAAACVARAQAAFALGMPEAENQLRAALDVLNADGLAPEAFAGPHFPRRYAAFDVELERVYGFLEPGSLEWAAALRRLLQWQVCASLAELCFASERFQEASEFAARAVELWPELGETRRRRADALRALGRAEEALSEYVAAVAAAPFDMEARTVLVRLRLDVQRPDAALTDLDEWIALLDGCPGYEAHRPTALRLRAEAATRAARPNSANDRVTRLLAFPDWNDPTDWQSLIATFAQTYRPTEQVLLMVRVDPALFPDARSVLARLEHFLTVHRGIPSHALPNVTLVTEPLAASDRWKLFYAAHALIAGRPLPAQYQQLAEVCRVPVWTLEEVRTQEAGVRRQERLVAA